MNQKEVVKQLSTDLGVSETKAAETLEAVLDVIYANLKHGESVSLRNFGTFYINRKSSGTVFKFNPSQKMKKMLGWSSTYIGKI